MNSPDGFSPQLWGPAAWHFLRCIAFNYPLEPTKHDVKHYHQFLKSLGNVLPCRMCRENFQVHFARLAKPECFTSRRKFARLVFALENAIKRSPRSFKQVCEWYAMLRNNKKLSGTVNVVPKQPNSLSLRYLGKPAAA